MIVITKKKILYIFSFVAIFLVAYIFTSYNIKNNTKENIKTIQTVALPVNKKIIVIDAGHGKPDERC